MFSRTDMSNDSCSGGRVWTRHLQAAKLSSGLEGARELLVFTFLIKWRAKLPKVSQPRSNKGPVVARVSGLRAKTRIPAPTGIMASLQAGPEQAWWRLGGWAGLSPRSRARKGGHLCHWHQQQWQHQWEHQQMTADLLYAYTYFQLWNFWLKMAYTCLSCRAWLTFMFCNKSPQQPKVWQM